MSLETLWSKIGNSEWEHWFDNILEDGNPLFCKINHAKKRALRIILDPTLLLEETKSYQDTTMDDYQELVLVASQINIAEIEELLKPWL